MIFRKYRKQLNEYFDFDIHEYKFFVLKAMFVTEEPSDNFQTNNEDQVQGMKSLMSEANLLICYY